MNELGKKLQRPENSKNTETKSKQNRIADVPNLKLTRMLKNE